MIETHLSPINTRFRSAAHYASLPREASLLEEKWLEVINSIRLVLQEGSECFHSKKVAYQAQLKKVRDNANVAIRNAMQVGDEIFKSKKKHAYIRDFYFSF